MPTHAVLILAAGASRRLGTAKQLLRQHGEPLIRRVAELALATQADAVYVVTGAHGDAIAHAIQDLPIHRLDNADWASGMASSLQCGAAAIRADAEQNPELRQVLILGCDQLRLTAAHLQRLLQIGAAQPDAIVVSGYGDSFGIPILLPIHQLAAIASLHGDRGLKAWLQQYTGARITVAAAELVFDLDTPADRDYAIGQHWLDPC